MNGKALVASKEFWFNVIMFFIDSAAYFEKVLPQEFLPWLVGFHVIGNIFIRTFFTSQPITSFLPKRPTV